MRRLWVQLSLAFSIVVLVSTVLMLVISITYTERERAALERELIERVTDTVLFGEAGVVEALQTQIENDGIVRNARRILMNVERTQARAPFRISLQLLAPNNRIVYGRIPLSANYEEVPIVDYTLRYSIQLPQSRPVPELPGGLSPGGFLLVLVVIGTLIGIGMSILLSRRLAAPLSRLAETARQFGNRDFSLRVQPLGTEEVRDVAKAFNEMASQLQVSEQLRSNMVADVAHELRTPLTVMESNLRAIIDDVYPLSKTEVLTLYDQTRHLTRLVNDLHELSLADAQELQFVRERVDLNVLLNSIAEIFKPVAELEGIEVRVSLPGTPTFIWGDQVRLRQVIQNLLVNALRHTSAGGRILIDLQMLASHVCLQIADNGVGIPAEHLTHVFERFYRVDRGRDRSSGGTGLGLAIGKAIIEAHGGNISVTSSITAPSGTRFMIELPN